MKQTNLAAKKEITAALTKNLLDTIILQLLNEEDMHGYQIMTKIRKNYGISFGPSTIYPLLTLLEKKGQLQSAWDMKCERPRKVFKLTETGKSILAYSETALTSFCKNFAPSTNTVMMVAAHQ